MDILKDLVQNIVVIVILTTFLDLLLPSSSMQRFVKVVMGLFILVSLLNPILELLSGSQEFEVFSWEQPQAVSGSSILAGSERMKETNEGLFIDNYSIRLEKQMEALLKYVKDVESAIVKVEINNVNEIRAQDSIKSVHVTVRSEEGGEGKDNPGIIEPINIQVGKTANKDSAHNSPHKAETGEERLSEQEIKQILFQYFGLMPKQVMVVFF